MGKSNPPQILEELLRAHTPQGVLTFAVLVDGRCAIYEDGAPTHVSTASERDRDDLLKLFLVMCQRCQPHGDGHGDAGGDGDPAAADA